ncbi:FAD-linked oxidase C-terminal domain-containing protein [Paenalcaligenes suwonensis]|nr:FAD-linked oxidase C-terminal domain-containing protein [Paenalcaligenes suwonensis]
MFRAQGAVTSAFHPLPEPMLRLQQRLKKAFDPAGVLNPGRLYTGVL